MTTRKGDIRSKALWKTLRLTILARDNHTCTYCGHYPANTIDHIQPLSHGGDPHNQDNLTTACGKCNSIKGNRTNHTIHTNHTNNNNQTIFSDGTSTPLMAQGRFISGGNMSALGGNGRDLTVNVLGSVPFL